MAARGEQSEFGKIARPRRDSHAFAPVFVLAPPRSYTSVISAMLGQHPDLAGLPELKLFSYRTIGELEASLPQYWIDRGFTHRSPGLVRALAEYMYGGQTAEDLAQARVWLHARPHWAGAEVLDVLLARLAPRGVVEKSPENVATAAALRRLGSAYPAARYLHLTRHPVTTQMSMAAHGARTVPEHPLDGQPMAGVAAWLAVHRRILRFGARLPKGRMLRMRAEDVLNDPIPHLRAIAEWLGLRADEEAIAAMRRPEASPFAHPGPAGSGVIGGYDPGFLENPVPRAVDLPHDVDQPGGWRGEPGLWRATLKLAHRLGYGEAPGSHRRRTRGERKPLSLKALRAELLRRAAIDQAARAAYSGTDAEAARLIAADEDNAQWLERIVDAIGWPGRALVGDEAAHAAWLIAQHADRRPALQRRCLRLLKQAVAAGEASDADLAHLVDRVLLARGKEQLYGTQLAPCAEGYAPPRLRDAKRVDARRAAVGLAPLALDTVRARERYGPPAPARAPCPRCRAPFEIWMPAPGGSTRFKCPACGASGTVQPRTYSESHARSISSASA